MILNVLRKIFRILKPIEKKKLNMVYEDDLEELLINIGMKEKIDSGTEVCPVCEDSINYENLLAVVKKDGLYRIICSKQKCLDSVQQD